jgi:arginyl-tRNA synthetase
MKNIITQLESLFRIETVPDLTQSTQPQFGDYQCNNALKLAKMLGLNPRAVAQKIIDNLPPDAYVERYEIAGPGFINVYLSALFIAKEVNAMIIDPKLGIELPERSQKVIVEYSSPNVAKELHVGHLRSTIIGECLARLFEFVGHTVIRLNHVGDWGTQFGMLIAYMLEHHPSALEGKIEVDLTSLMQWYKASKKAFDEDASFKKRAQLQVVLLQSGDEQTLKSWRMICAISRQAYQKIYDLLDVCLVERGESFYNPFLSQMVSEVEKKGLMTISDGAKCVYLEGFINREGDALPIIIQKSDGGYNYDTTDLAALHHRIKIEAADRLIYVVDGGQSLHFQMIFKLAEKMEYLDFNKTQVDHVAFGVVLGPDGKKFKTRSGETERLIDLLDQAIGEAKKILQERHPDIDEMELTSMAKVLGLGAVKYADLSSHRIKDYIFSYERMLRFEGNTAAFLLYAYVRIQSIKRKVGKELSIFIEAPILLDHSSERALALHLRQFGETLDQAIKDLLPNRISDYLYNLAEKFHAFFRDCRVEGVPEENSRLALCEATGRVMKQGLYILGVKTLDKM